MISNVKKVNAFFKSVTRNDVDNILSAIILSDRQKAIFEMYYIRKLDAGFIADKLNVSYSVIKNELNAIRTRIVDIIH